VSQVLSGLLQAELQVALRNRYCRSILQWAFAQSIRYRVGTQCCGTAEAQLLLLPTVFSLKQMQKPDAAAAV